MQAIRRILVAVKEPGSGALPAVDKAARLAKAFGASLDLFHAITDPVLVDAWMYSNGEFGRFRKETRTRVQDQLENIAAPLRKRGLDVRVCTTWDFAAHEAIVRHARRHKADLIVAECHRGRRVAPWLLHLTDWELLRTSPAPVLLVKSGATWADLNVLAAIDPAHRFAKPAELDATILDTADAFRRALKGRLHVVHAYNPLPAGSVPMTGTSALVVQQIAQGSEVLAKTSFQAAVGAYRLPRNQLHLVEGSPVDQIPGVVEEIGCGLVVMGAVARSGLKRALIGNTAERVLGALRCDVLVVKPTEFRTNVSKRVKGMHFVGIPGVGLGA